MKKKSSLDIQFDDPIQTSAQNNNEIGPFQKKNWWMVHFNFYKE
jgi:hypothetical protein